MVSWWAKIHQEQGRGQEPGPMEGGHPGGPGEPVVQPATDYAPKEVRGGRGCGWYAFFASYLTHPTHYNAPIRKKRKEG